MQFLFSKEFFTSLLLLPALFLFSACSANHYRRRADREVAGIIAVKGDTVPGMLEEFRIERTAFDPLAGLPLAPESARLFEDQEDAGPAWLLDLQSALRIAVANSRDYQRRKEAVFLQALALTGERNRLQPQFSWLFRGNADYDSERDWSVGGRTEPGAEWLLAGGARLSLGLSTAVSQFLAGDPAMAARSVLDLTLTQPLLRQGRLATLEPLTQAERDMLYELRDFVRFQRRFTVAVLADYYRILERRQRVENQQVNYDNLVRLRRRAEALGEAGRLPELQLDRARQDELSASDSLEQAEQDYYRALDEFKLALGLGPATRIMPDPQELQRLRERALIYPPVDRAQSIELALRNRLDLVVARERVEDAERKVRVARQSLRPGLNLIFNASASTGDDDVVGFAAGTQSGSLGLQAELPLERTSERNTYRRRLIEFDQANRGFAEQRDQVMLDVTNRWRDFERALSGHEIQSRSVELARERVESTEMLFDAGRATTRDVLDAHEDLLRTQNRLAQTLVDVRIATLELERDMDILVVDEDGQLLEGVGFDEYTSAN